MSFWSEEKMQEDRDINDYSLIKPEDFEYTLLQDKLTIKYIGHKKLLNYCKLLVRYNNEIYKLLDLSYNNKFSLEKLVQGIVDPGNISLSIVYSNSKNEVILLKEISNFIGADKLVIYKAIISTNNENIIVYLDSKVNNSNKYEVAYYLLKDEKVYKKFMYPQEFILSEKLLAEGDYRFKVFVRNNATKNKVSFETDTLFFENNNQLKDLLDNLKNDNLALKQDLIKSKEKIVSVLEKEEKLLIAHKKLMKDCQKFKTKYNALSRSKLGKLTVKYWSLRKGWRG